MYEPIYGRKEKKKNILLPTLGLITVIAILFIVVIRPSYLGYSIYQDIQQSNTNLETYTKNIQDINQELQSSKTNLTYQQTQSQQLQTDLKQTSQQLIDCQISEKTTAKELELLKKTHQLELKTLQQQLDQQKSTSDQKLLAKDDELKQKIELKNEQIASLQKQTTEKTQTIQEKCTIQQQDNKEELTKLQQQLKDLETSYTLLTQNSAKNICCKQKFDNPQISSYTIIENKITCLTQGENKLNC